MSCTYYIDVNKFLCITSRLTNSYLVSTNFFKLMIELLYFHKNVPCGYFAISEKIEFLINRFDALLFTTESPALRLKAENLWTCILESMIILYFVYNIQVILKYSNIQVILNYVWGGYGQ